MVAGEGVGMRGIRRDTVNERAVRILLDAFLYYILVWSRPYIGPSIFVKYLP